MCPHRILITALTKEETLNHLTVDAASVITTTLRTGLTVALDAVLITIARTPAAARSLVLALLVVAGTCTPIALAIRHADAARLALFLVAAHVLAIMTTLAVLALVAVAVVVP